MSDKYVNPLSASKLVVLVKSALSGKLDKSGGTITGDLEVNGDVHSNGAIQSDLLLSAPAVTVHNDTADSTVNIACTGDNSARISSLGSDGKLRYSRLAVGTPTGDNDASTKAYVDSKSDRYYDIPATMGARSPDGSIEITSEEKTASIRAAIGLGKNPRVVLSSLTRTYYLPLTGYADIGADYAYCEFGCVDDKKSITAYCDGAAEQTGDNPTWGGWQTAIPSVDDALSDSSENPVQNKAVTEAVNSKADRTEASETAPGLMSTTDKAKLNGIEAGANKTIVDDAMSDTSTNPVQNKVVMNYIDSRGSLPPVSTQDDTMLIQVVNGAYALRTKESIFPVDDALDTESKNAVENGIIARRFEQLSGAMLPATSKRDGLMSAADYTKLSGIEAGANKTVVDASLDAGSDNPVQNKAVKAALDGKAGTAVATTSANGLMSTADKAKLDGVEAGANKTTVDAALDAASENPVQNKAVKAALDGKLDKTGGTLTGNLKVTGALFSGDGLSFGTGENIHFTKAADDAGKLAHGAAGVDDTVPLARLKVAAPTEDDDAATKAYVDGRAAGSGAVRYDAAQTLEAAQQFQARKNIGAVGHDSPQFKGFLSLAPANGTLGTGVGLSPTRDGNNYALDISDVNENSPTLLTGVKTPTDANTNAAATVEYVLAKAAGGSTPLTLTYANRQVTGASYSDIRKAIESGRQIKLSVANTPDIIASNARNETNKSVVIFINTDVGGDTVNIAQYTVTAQASGVTGNVKSHELA